MAGFEDCYPFIPDGRVQIFVGSSASNLGLLQKVCVCPQNGLPLIYPFISALSVLLTAVLSPFTCKRID